MKKNLLFISLLFFIGSFPGFGQTPQIVITLSDTIGSNLSFSANTGDSVTATIDFGNGIPVSIDTSCNCLSGKLVGSNTVKIYCKVPIVYFSSYYNSIQSIDFSNDPDLNGLTLNYGGLSILNLSSNPVLQYLDCSYNNLISLDVSKDLGLAYLNCSNNQLTTLNINPDAPFNIPNTGIYTLLCNNNNLTFSSLPYPNVSWRNFYYYVPQNPMKIESTYTVGDNIDLSSQSSANGYPTTYTWILDDGINTALVNGIDYNINNGVTTFLKPQTDSVHCQMTNDEFPQMNYIFVNDTSGGSYQYNYFNTSNTFIYLKASVKSENSTPSINIYSADKNIYVSTSEDGQMSIFDLSGKDILEQNISAGNTIVPINNTGIYIVKVLSGNDVQTHKVFIQ